MSRCNIARPTRLEDNALWVSSNPTGRAIMRSWSHQPPGLHSQYNGMSCHVGLFPTCSAPFLIGGRAGSSVGRRQPRARVKHPPFDMKFLALSSNVMWSCGHVVLCPANPDAPAAASSALLHQTSGAVPSRHDSAYRPSRPAATGRIAGCNASACHLRKSACWTPDSHDPRDYRRQWPDRVPAPRP